MNVIRKVVDECIDGGILREYLMKNRAEVENMSIWEYDEEKQLAMERAEGRIEGRAEERVDGIILMVETYQEMGQSLEEAIVKTAGKYQITITDVENVVRKW